MMPFYLKFLLVFISMILTDAAWAIYMIKVEERKAISAGIWSGLIILFGAYTITSYVEDKRLMIAAILGAFVGTAGIVFFKKK